MSLSPSALFQETPEKQLAKEAGAWWADGARERRGLPPFKKLLPLSWLKEFPGSISWSAPYSWLLYRTNLCDSQDKPMWESWERQDDYFRSMDAFLQPFFEEMEVLVPRSLEEQASSDGNLLYEWVMRVEREVVRQYQENAQNSP